METRKPRMTSRAIYISIVSGISEYRQRHNGEKPARVAMTTPVYGALMESATVIFTPSGPLFCGIPVDVVNGNEYRINLVEPELLVYDPETTTYPYDGENQ